MTAVATKVEVSVEDFLAAHEKASFAAQKATGDWLAANGDRDMCGFAWVEIYGVRSNSKLGVAMQKVGFRKGYGKGAGLHLWNPARHGTQSITAKEEGAYAYAIVMKDLGLKCYTGSRLD